MLVVFLPIFLSVMYITVACFRYRSVYRRMYTQYLRWQNEAPNKMQRIGYSSDPYSPPPKDVPRKNITWYEYKTDVFKGMAPYWEAMGWPVLLFSRPLNRFLHPEVKVPSLAKSLDLERELEQITPDSDDVPALEGGDY